MKIVTRIYPILLSAYCLLFSIQCVGTVGGGGSDKKESSGGGNSESVHIVSSFGRPSHNTAGELNLPSGVTVDANGDVYVCTDLNASINKFDADGNFITRWTVHDCFGLETDGDNNLFVAARFTHKVLKYDPNGNLLREWGSYGNGIGQFNTLNDVAVNRNLGRVYVADTRNLRVQVFDTDGNFLFTWGSSGSGDGQFTGPRGPVGIAVDQNTGSVYVTDSEVRRVQKFDQEGNFEFAWGVSGTGENQFYWPRALEVDGNGDVYVVDGDNERIQKFDSSGNLLMVIKGEPYIDSVTNPPTCYAHLSHTDCTVIHNITDGPFHPRDVAVDPLNSTIYVAAAYAQRVDKFNFSGEYIDSWGWWERDNGVLNHPTGMAIDLTGGYIYVADMYNFLIQKFDLSGNFLTSWGYTGRVTTIFDGGDGSFDFPATVATDDTGNVYVINPSATYPGDPPPRRVQKFDQDGTFLQGWNYIDAYGWIHTHNLKGIIYNPFNGCVYVSSARYNTIQCFDTDGNFNFEFGGPGYTEGTFNFVTKMAIDRRNGNIFVMDMGNQRIQKFTSDGVFLTMWGSYGNGDGEFRLEENSGLYVDDNGYVYVSDSGNDSIDVFDSDGNFILDFFVGGKPTGIVVDTEGYIYIADYVNDKIDIYSPISR